MQQLELFDFRRDILFERDNQIARFYDVLSETKDEISYAEHIDAPIFYFFVILLEPQLI